MRWLFLLLVSCATVKPLPPVTGVCMTPIEPVTKDICGGLFTVDGYPCVRCHVATGCVNRELGVYCVSTDCTDATCSPATRWGK